MLHQNKLVSVQILRAIACLLVLQVHIFNYIPYIQVKFCGSIGVDIFFIISGYVIASSIDNLPGKGSTRLFFINRISRVVPFYYLMTAITAFVIFLFSHTFDEEKLLNSFLFLPQKNDPTLFLGWSLNHELFFYAFVGLSLYAFYDKHILIAVSFFIFLLLCKLLPFSSYLFSFLKSGINYTFVLGFLIYHFRNKILPFFQKKIFLLASSVLIVLVGIFSSDLSDNAIQLQFLHTNNNYQRDFVFFYKTSAAITRFGAWGLPSAFLFSSFLANDFFFKRFSNSLLMKIGDASYSLYLVQGIVVFLFNQLLKPPSFQIRLLVFTLTIVVSLQLFKAEGYIARVSKNALRKMFEERSEK